MFDKDRTNIKGLLEAMDKIIDFTVDGRIPKK